MIEKIFSGKRKYLWLGLALVIIVIYIANGSDNNYEKFVSRSETPPSDAKFSPRAVGGFVGQTDSYTEIAAEEIAYDEASGEMVEAKPRDVIKTGNLFL